VLLTKRPNEVAASLPSWKRAYSGEKEVHHGYMSYFCHRNGQYHVPCHEPIGSAIIEIMKEPYKIPFEK